MRDNLNQNEPDRVDVDGVHVVGDQSNGGTYVLRLRAVKAISLALGGFKRGKVITFARGEFLYVGSALSEQGATTLARRLVRHATRSGRRPSHALRKLLLRRVHELELMAKDCVFNDEKRLRWQVDYFLDRSEVDLIGVYAIRAHDRIEGKLAKLLENDPATSIVERGLGASDIPGNTHLLRVDADKIWWRLLLLRMQALAKSPNSGDLIEAYLCGRRCLSMGGYRDPRDKVSFAKHVPARVAAETIARQLAIPEDQVIKDAKFALAVESILGNCGEAAADAIFSVDSPQSRFAVERIARTSDERQRYRVDGVLAGKFRSLAPQGADPVYDTVGFAEVVSRLSRAAGLLEFRAVKLRSFHSTEAVAVTRLLQGCHAAARTLRLCMIRHRRRTSRIPNAIARKAVGRLFTDISASGQTVGKLKAALKLIVKNAWDFGEMTQRGIKPTTRQHSQTVALIDNILHTLDRDCAAEGSRKRK